MTTGLWKVAGCQRKSLPTWLVSAGYSAWHFFTDGVFSIKYPWTGRLLWQLSCLLQNFLTTLWPTSCYCEWWDLPQKSTKKPVFNPKSEYFLQFETLMTQKLNNTYSACKVSSACKGTPEESFYFLYCV